MDPLSKRLCDFAVLLFFLPVISSNTRCINYYGRSRALCFMAYCPIYHAVRSSFNPTQGYRRELKKQRHLTVALSFFSTGLCLTSYRLQSALTRRPDAGRHTSTRFRTVSGSTGERIHRPGAQGIKFGKCSIINTINFTLYCSFAGNRAWIVAGCTTGSSRYCNSPVAGHWSSSDCCLAVRKLP